MCIIFADDISCNFESGLCAWESVTTIVHKDDTLLADNTWTRTASGLHASLPLFDRSTTNGGESSSHCCSPFDIIMILRTYSYLCCWGLLLFVGDSFIFVFCLQKATMLYMTTPVALRRTPERCCIALLFPSSR